jgi:hypothetical protein
MQPWKQQDTNKKVRAGEQRQWQQWQKRKQEQYDVVEREAELLLRSRGLRRLRPHIRAAQHDQRPRQQGQKVTYVMISDHCQVDVAADWFHAAVPSTCTQAQRLLHDDIDVDYLRCHRQLISS